MKNNFKFFVDIDDLQIEKATDRTGGELLVVTGCASTADRDADGDYLDPNGFNFKPFLEEGYINWHHQATKNPKAIIGKPLDAWVDGGKFYIKGGLYPWNDLGKTTYDLIQGLKKSGSKRKLGWSIEGQADERDEKNPEYVKRATITHVAITPMPKNKGTWVDLVKGMDSVWGDDDLEETDDELLFFNHPNGYGIRITNEDIFIYDIDGKQKRFSLNDEGEDIDKALTTQSGAALIKEDVEPGLKTLTFKKAKLVDTLLYLHKAFESGVIGVENLDLFRSLIKAGFPIGYFTVDKYGDTWVKVADNLDGKNNWKKRQDLTEKEAVNFLHFHAKPLHERVDFKQGYKSGAGKHYYKEFMVPNISGGSKLSAVHIKQEGKNWNVYGEGGEILHTNNSFAGAANFLASGGANTHFDKTVGTMGALTPTKQEGAVGVSSRVGDVPAPIETEFKNFKVSIEGDPNRSDRYWVKMGDIKLAHYSSREQAAHFLVEENLDYISNKGAMLSNGEKFKFEKGFQNSSHIIGKLGDQKVIGTPVRGINEKKIVDANKAYFEVLDLLGVQKGTKFASDKNGSWIFTPVSENIGEDNYEEKMDLSAYHWVNLLFGVNMPTGGNGENHTGVVISDGKTIQLPTNKILGLVSPYLGTEESLKQDSLVLLGSSKGADKLNAKAIKTYEKMKKNKDKILKIMNKYYFSNNTKIAFKERLNKILG